MPPLRSAHSSVLFPSAILALALAAAPGEAGAQALDVVGIKPGMPAQAALAQAKAQNPKLQGEMQPASQFDLLPGTAFVEGAHLQYSPGDGVNNGEVVQLLFTMPPSKPMVWSVLRAVDYAEPKRPTAGNVIAALREKYGKETGEMHPGTGRAYGVEWTSAFWTFDAQGQKVTGPQADAARSCLNNVQKSYLNGLQQPPNPNMWSSYHNGKPVSCSGYVTVTALMQMMAPGMGTPGLVNRLQVEVTDYARYHDAFEASMALLDGAEAKKAQGEQEQAKGVKPKL